MQALACQKRNKARIFKVIRHLLRALSEKVVDLLLQSVVVLFLSSKNVKYVPYVLKQSYDSESLNPKGCVL